MALVETDVLLTGDSDLGRVILGAIAGELDATNLYTRMAEKYPAHKEALLEIARDEIQHTGKLIDLMCKIEPDYEKELNKGAAENKAD